MWTDSLPLILLGIDLHYIAAELVYDTTLRLPGKYFDNSVSDTNTSNLSDYVTKLKLIKQYLIKDIPLRFTVIRKTYVNNDLLTSAHVFV